MTLYANGIKVAPTIKVGSGDRYLIQASDESLMPSWYRIYSDGWCEQGGYAEIESGYSGVRIDLLYYYPDQHFDALATKTQVKYGAISVTGQLHAIPTVYPEQYKGKRLEIENVWDASNLPIEVFWQAKGFIDLSQLEESEE